MKKIIQLTLLLHALLLPTIAHAYSFAVDGIYYKITSENEVAVTYKYYWNGGDDPDEWYSDYSGDIVIPPYVTNNGKTYSVTAIGDHAFEECSDVTSLSIPSTMKTMSDLYECTGVKELIWNAISCNYMGGLPKSNIERVTIGYGVESLPSDFVKGSKITSVTIPNSVTTISSGAFQNCSSLSSITFSSSLINLSSTAFEGTAWYNNQPNGLVYAGWVAYRYKGYMSSGTNISLTSGTIAIAAAAFSGCAGLKSITIPNSVVVIGSSAFNGCTGLTSLTIPSSVTTIGGSSFNGCTGLTSMTIPNSVTSIGSYAFKGCTGLTTLNIPNSITFIGDYAFQNCSGISGFNIPSSLTSIGQYTFNGCSSLTSIVIPNSVTSIGKCAFYQCTNLSYITIPSTCLTISKDAFYETAWYNNQPNGVIYAGKVALCYKGTMSSGTSISLTNGTITIANEAFYQCTNLASVTIPSTITSIGQSAFYGCSGLTRVNITDLHSWCNITFGYYSNPISVAHHIYINDAEVIDLVIPNSVTTISNYAFDGCTGLTSMTIPNTVTTIGSSAFSDCTGLTSITIPESVTTIGSYAFCGCSGLVDLTMPNSVTHIGERAFYECEALKKIYSYILNPSQIVGYNFFDDDDDPYYDEYWHPGYYSSRTLYVPYKTASTYRASDSWNQYFGSIVEMAPDPVLATSIELDVTETEVTEGESLQLTATILPEDATDKSVTWTTSDVAVAMVDQNGLVTAIAPGTTTITATTVDGSNLTASCMVTVEPNVVLATSITLNQTSAGMNEGETLQLTATVLPEDATDRTVTWASSDEAVTTVDQNGLVTAVATGTATITATTIDGSDLSASCEVTVNSPAVASNTLDADALSAYCGEEKQLAVRMDNESSITALQCDIYLPEGISIATQDGDYLIDLVPARRATNHTVSTYDLPNGAIRLFITSATSKPFKGNSGDLFILNLIVDEDAESGEYSIDLRNVILSDTEAHPYYVSDLNVPITVLDYIKGDVNIDGTVNVSDYVATANYILEMDPHPFLFAAADIDENQTINVSDLVGVANIALNFMGVPAIYHAPVTGNDEVGTMALVANSSSIATDRYAVTLDLSNSSAVTAFQMDVNLPNGMKLVGATLSNRASSSHSLEMNELANGAYRLLGASMMSKTFAGNEGTLLTLEIEGSTSGMAVIDGIMLAEPDATLHRHDAIIFTFDDASGVHEMYNEVRIYTEDGKVVVESPIATKVQFILPNGMSLTKEVKSGRNVYDTGFNGVVIVKVDTQVKKFKL